MATKRNHVILNVIALFIAFLALFGAVGSLEYTDEVYYSIPDGALEEIRARVGDTASRQDIIQEYLSDKMYYDRECLYGGSEISRNFNAD